MSVDIIQLIFERYLWFKLLPTYTNLTNVSLMVTALVGFIYKCNGDTKI